MSELAGTTVLLTRAPGANAELAALLRERGAEVLELACSRVEQLDPAPLARTLASTGPDDLVVLTSAAAADALARAIAPAALRARVAAVGPATARRASALGLAAWLPSQADGASLGREVPLPHGEIIWPRADRADRGLVRELEARGAAVREIVAYRVLPDVAGDVAIVRARLAAAGRGVVVLYSPAALDALLTAIPRDELARVACVALGRTTAASVASALGTAPTVPASVSPADVARAVVDLAPAGALA